MRTDRRWAWILALVVAAAAGHYASVFAQQAPVAKAPALKFNGKFEIEVIESFDAKYQGDTPGHIGKHGELGDFRPQAALGDPVFRGDEKVGTVTNLLWSPGHGSLQVEFDPEPKVRIAVGDVVWLKFGDK